MRQAKLLVGAALAMTSVWALAQDAPESLLPPGFDNPAPKPAPSRAPAAAPGRPAPVEQNNPGPAPQTASGSGGSGSSGGSPAYLPTVPAPGNPAIKLPSIAELEKMSPEEFEELLNLKPKTDIPGAARRSMLGVGILAENEGGLRAGSLAGQNASLVRAALDGNKGALVSRWGHILLRRALASRLDAPAGMNPADFAAKRAALLVRMGEGEAARALVQDVDTGNYTPALTEAAFDAYIFTADFTGICPATTLFGKERKDPQWEVASSVCRAFRGEGAEAMRQLDRAMSRGTMSKIDLLLAQKYAGAAGKARRAVTIEWDEVSDMTPWRYALAIGVGLEPPATLMQGAGPRYDYMAATAPMLGLTTRAAAADRAAGKGLLSSAAMVDLYSQIYADEDIEGDWQTRAGLLRDAYVGGASQARLAAMQQLWDSATDPAQRYSRQVLTAYAAARLPVDESFAASAPDIVASMLAAGLDGNALRWAKQADEGSLAWGQLVLAMPSRRTPVDSGALDSFYDDDQSTDARKSAFLLAGLAGLGRVSNQDARDFAGRLEINLDRKTRWTRLIDQAADVNNAALVALLAGVGMQGDGWHKMTPLHLYYIVSALNRVGLKAEARMIAAEAVARG